MSEFKFDLDSYIEDLDTTQIALKSGDLQPDYSDKHVVEGKVSQDEESKIQVDSASIDTLDKSIDSESQSTKFVQSSHERGSSLVRLRKQLTRFFKNRTISFYVTGFLLVGGLYDFYGLADMQMRNAILSDPLIILIFVGCYSFVVFWGSSVFARYIFNTLDILFPSRSKRSVAYTYIPDPPNFENELLICLGEVHHPESGDRFEQAQLLNLKEKSLYTNLYVFGSIGSGKTVFLLSVLDQILQYKRYDPLEKPCGLFLDEKGTLGTEVKAIAQRQGRGDDVYVFELNGKIIWNVIHDPLADAGVIARRLKTIMEQTIEKGADWIRAYAYEFLLNTINLVRITSPDYYVTLLDIHQMVFKEDLIVDKLKYFKNNKVQIKDNLGKIDTDLKGLPNLNMYLEDQYERLKTYFNDSWFLLKNKDPEVYGYISTSLSQLIEPLIDPKVKYIFNPDHPSKINFKGFDWMINEGKLFVYSVPDSIYEGLGKYISLFMKLPFQKTCLSRIPKTNPETHVYDPNYNSQRPILFVADENQNSYHPSDNDALDKLREAKVIHICLTQNYVSLLAKQPHEQKIRQYIGSFRNKLFLGCDDDRSAKYYSELCGQEFRTHLSKSVSESSRSSSLDLSSADVYSSGSAMNQSVSVQKRYENYFPYTRFLKLKLFQGIFTGFDGKGKIDPQVVYVKPYFRDWYESWFDM